MMANATAAARRVEICARVLAAGRFQRVGFIRSGGSTWRACLADFSLCDQDKQPSWVRLREPCVTQTPADHDWRQATLPNDGMRGGIRRIPLMLYGLLCFCVGIVMYLFGVLLVIPRYVLGLNATLLPFNEWIVWYSGIPIVLGVAFTLIDLLLLFPAKRHSAPVRFDALPTRPLTVVLTAYNDEQSIGAAVRDFRAHPLVGRVIVVSNNSTDATIARAQEAGAITFDEPAQGYGRCVYRCLSEAVKVDEGGLIVLCEGDRTFRAYDLDKLLAYAPHADIVNGTRTVERLREYTTQLSTFMYYGNLFVGKLLEAKHLGRSTITDVGTTYKLCRPQVVQTLLTTLDASINLEFNAYFLDTALRCGFFVVECPITFYQRVGVSKGGNTGNWRAMVVGCRMMMGIVFGWWPGRS